jgi:hypothetical protein
MLRTCQHRDLVAAGRQMGADPDHRYDVARKWACCKQITRQALTPASQVSWTRAPDGNAAIAVKSVSALGTHGGPRFVAMSV